MQHLVFLKMVKVLMEIVSFCEIYIYLPFNLSSFVFFGFYLLALGGYTGQLIEF